MSLKSDTVCIFYTYNLITKCTTAYSFGSPVVLVFLGHWKCKIFLLLFVLLLFNSSDNMYVEDGAPLRLSGVTIPVTAFTETCTINFLKDSEL